MGQWTKVLNEAGKNENKMEKKQRAAALAMETFSEAFEWTDL